MFFSNDDVKLPTWNDHPPPLERRPTIGQSITRTHFYHSLKNNLIWKCSQAKVNRTLTKLDFNFIWRSSGFLVVTLMEKCTYNIVVFTQFRRFESAGSSDGTFCLSVTIVDDNGTVTGTRSHCWRQWRAQRGVRFWRAAIYFEQCPPDNLLTQLRFWKSCFFFVS